MELKQVCAPQSLMQIPWVQLVHPLCTPRSSLQSQSSWAAAGGHSGATSINGDSRPQKLPPPVLSPAVPAAYVVHSTGAGSPVPPPPGTPPATCPP